MESEVELGRYSDAVDNVKFVAALRDEGINEEVEANPKGLGTLEAEGSMRQQ